MLKKWKSLFFEEQGKKGEEVVTETTETVNEEVIETVSAPINTNSAVVSGQVDEKLLSVLDKALAESNIDGFDYMEYRESVKSLSKMDMTEATRYQSAFAMAKTMGATPARLIQSAEYYLDILKQEQQKFAGVIQNQQKAKIGDKANRITQMEQIVQQKYEEINKIKVEIDTLNKDIEKAKSGISSAQNKITQTKLNFESTFEIVFSKIQEDISKMKTYLK